MRKSLWLWVVLAVFVILVLAMIFGGYRKGTKLGAPADRETVVQSHPGAGLTTLSGLPR